MRKDILVSKLLLSSLLSASALLTIGCAEHRQPRGYDPNYGVYDPYYRDQHRWDPDEDRRYREWEEQNHQQHHDYKERSSDQQKQYWDYRHKNGGKDRDDRRDDHKDKSHDDRDNHTTE